MVRLSPLGGWKERGFNARGMCFFYLYEFLRESPQVLGSCRITRVMISRPQRYVSLVIYHRCSWDIAGGRFLGLMVGLARKNGKTRFAGGKEG